MSGTEKGRTGKSGADKRDATSSADNLQELVDRRLTELGSARGPMSTRQAAARSGGKVSYETLRLIKIGQHSGSISQEVAEGIAEALEVPVTDVLHLAGRRIPQGPFVLPRRAETLTKSERAVVLSVVDAILDAAGQEREQDEAGGATGSTVGTVGRGGRGGESKVSSGKGRQKSPSAGLRAVAEGGAQAGGGKAGARKASQTARRVRRGQEGQR
jgi:hypothetical protein